MIRKLAGAFLLLCLPFAAAGIDKSKKVYELIYEDVQIIKKQLLMIEERLEQNTEDILLLKNQLKDLQSQLKLFQSEQAGVQGELRNIPTQYRVLLEKFDYLSLQLAKISEELLAIRGVTPQATGPEPEESKSGKEQAPPPNKKEEAATSARTPASAPSISPQEVYNMAYSDYLKGNFDLAIDGFKIYREQFPDSPLADNALYWIGECLFSQQKLNEAINVFNDLILDYPSGDTVAAAYLKKGISLMDLGKKEEALSVFRLLVAKYPLDEETKIAQQKIKDLTLK